MSPYPVITQIYIVSAFVGSSFMVISTLLGKVPRHGSHGGGHLTHGHSGGAHGGAHHGIGHHGGHAPQISHGPSVGHGATGHGAAGHGAAGHTGPSGHAANTAHAAGHSVNAGHAHNAGHVADASHAVHAGATGHGATHSLTPGTVTGAQPASSMASGPVMTEPSGIITRALGKVHGLHVELKEENLLEAVLGFFNPLTMATFIAFFGLSGLAASLGFHLSIYFSLPIALVSGYVAVQVVVHTIAWLFESLGSSTEAKVADFVGRMAEVTIPIGIDKVGEVTYVINAKRYASPARSVDPTQALTRRAKVMICEVRDHLVLVEPWTDTFIDPEFETTKLS